MALWALALTAGQLAFTCVYSGPAIQDQAAAWIRKHAKRDAIVAVIGTPWYYTPPFVPDNGGPMTWHGGGLTYISYTSTNSLLSMDWQTLPNGGVNPPKYVVLADVQYREQLRIGVPEVRRFMSYLRQHYRPLKRFPDHGLRALVTHAIQDAPPDWRYPSPIITIYEHPPR